MKNTVKNKVIVIIFAVLILGFFVLNLAFPDKSISYAERRPLQSAPEISFGAIEDGSFMTDFEDYALDQFVGRDFWRSIKAYALYYLFGQKDNNGIYVIDGNASKYKYPLNEQSVINAANKFNTLMQNYFPDNNVYYSIIPDKNFFMAEDNGYLSIDFDKMQSLLADNVEGMTYVNLFKELKLENYYYSDIHWKQETLIPIAEKISEAMGNTLSGITYYSTSLENFKGVYAGQSGVSLKKDVLTYLTSDNMSNWKVEILNEKTLLMEETTLYAPELFNGTDGYDVYMHGATPIVSITTGKEGKGLFIFRDSFSSSIAPLLAEGYSKITLIDLRYINGSLLENFVDFGSGNDVLFMYGTEVLNSSAMLKM